MNDYLDLKGNLVHETAVICDNVKIGTGNVIMPFAVIGETGFIRNTELSSGIIEIGNNNRIGCNVCIMVGENGVTKIGDGNLIMNMVNIGHDVKIGSNCEIGAGTIIAGFAEIGDRVKIKIGVTVRNRKIIGNDVIVGMGSVVVKDIEKDKTVYGNPARCV